jgi:hypothetical protein
MIGVTSENIGGHKRGWTRRLDNTLRMTMVPLLALRQSVKENPSIEEMHSLEWYVISRLRPVFDLDLSFLKCLLDLDILSRVSWTLDPFADASWGETKDCVIFCSTINGRKAIPQIETLARTQNQWNLTWIWWYVEIFSSLCLISLDLKRSSSTTTSV